RGRHRSRDHGSDAHGARARRRAVEARPGMAARGDRSSLPEEGRHDLAAAGAAAGVILGPLATYDYPARELGGLNPSAEFRTKLDLYANIRPAKSRLGVGLTGKP